VPTMRSWRRTRSRFSRLSPANSPSGTRDTRRRRRAPGTAHLAQRRAARPPPPSGTAALGGPGGATRSADMATRGIILASTASPGIAFKGGLRPPGPLRAATFGRRPRAPRRSRPRS
jgi:hypothetical protein